MQQRGRPAAGPHTPPVQKFAESLVKCPKIEKFFAHKYWPEQKLPSLYMPHCRDFTFRRGDFLLSAAGAVGGGEVATLGARLASRERRSQSLMEQDDVVVDRDKFREK